MNRTSQILFRATRHLKELKNYWNLTEEDVTLPEYIQGFSLQKDEIIIGLYENTPGRIDECLLITDIGLHLYVNQGGWSFVAFHQIKGGEIPFDTGISKENIDEIRITTKSGKTMLLPIRGKTEIGCLDVFNFFRFLDHAISITEKYSSLSS